MRRALLLAILLALPAGTASAQDDDLAGLVEGLGVPSRRKACYRALVKRRDPRAVPLIVAALPGFDQPGQHYGVLALERHPQEKAIPALRNLTRRGHPHLRICAGAALYRLGDKFGLLSMADALLSEEVSSQARIMLIWRLYTVAEAPIQSALRSLLEVGEDYTLLYTVLYALLHQKDRKASAAAARLLRDERPPVRAMAAAFRVRAGHDEDARVLAAAFRSGALDATAWARVWAFIARTPRLPSTVLGALADRLYVESDTKRILQIVALIQKHGFRAGAAALRERLGDPDERVARAVFAALLAIPGAMPPEDLRPLLDSKRGLIRLAAADALRRHDDLTGMPVVEELLLGGAPDERKEAARILGLVKRSSVVAPLLVALLDGDRAVRKQALASLEGVLGFLFPYRRLNLELTGYQPGAPAGDRRRGADAIREWWEANRARDW